MAFGGENAESYYDEGLTAAMKGDVAAAIKFLERAIQLDRSFLAAHHQLGKCYLRLGQTERAVEILSRVLTERPGLVPARVDLGFALLAHGNVMEARAQFTQVLAAQPTNVKAHLGLAQAYFLEGKWSSAVTLAQAARASGGVNFAVLFLLGRAAHLAGDLDLAAEALKEAETLIEKSVELSPDAPEGHYLRGEVNFAQERYAVALEHYRAAEERAQPHRQYSAFGENFTQVDTLVKRALCLQRLGDIAGARALGNRVLEQEPGHKLGQALSEL